jgi:hypothetical protein
LSTLGCKALKARLIGDKVVKKMRQMNRLVRDLVGFARANKAYWLIPTVFALAFLSLIIFGGQSAAPFVYTLF